MPDVTLSNGKEITFDFYKITYREWKSFGEKQEKENVTDEKYARVGGLTLEEFLDLPLPDHHVYVKTFWVRARDPLADPKNSPSVPTSP